MLVFDGLALCIRLIILQKQANIHTNKLAKKEIRFVVTRGRCVCACMFWGAGGGWMKAVKKIQTISYKIKEY